MPADISPPSVPRSPGAPGGPGPAQPLPRYERPGAGEPLPLRLHRYGYSSPGQLHLSNGGRASRLKNLGVYHRVQNESGGAGLVGVRTTGRVWSLCDRARCFLGRSVAVAGGGLIRCLLCMLDVLEKGFMHHASLPEERLSFTRRICDARRGVRKTEQSCWL